MSASVWIQFLGYLNESSILPQSKFRLKCAMDNLLIGDRKLSEEFISFVHSVLQKYLLRMSTTLSEVRYSFPA